MEVLKANRKQEVKAAVDLGAVPSCGYRVVYALPGGDLESDKQSHRPESPLQVLANGVENRYLKVQVNPDGSLNLLDEGTGRRPQPRLLRGYRGCGRTKSGDLSRHLSARQLPPSGGRLAVALVHSGPLQVTYEVSLQLSAPQSALTTDRQRRRKTHVNCPVSYTLTLRQDAKSVEIRADSCEPRPRSIASAFASRPGLSLSIKSRPAGTFSVVARPVDLRPRGEGSQQAPVASATCNAAVRRRLRAGMTGLRGLRPAACPRTWPVREGRAPARSRSRSCAAWMPSPAAVCSARPEHAGVPCGRRGAVPGAPYVRVRDPAAHGDLAGSLPGGDGFPGAPLRAPRG